VHLPIVTCSKQTATTLPRSLSCKKKKKKKKQKKKKKKKNQKKNKKITKSKKQQKKPPIPNKPYLKLNFDF